jgi:arylsulfatase A-like enzyme
MEDDATCLPPRVAAGRRVLTRLARGRESVVATAIGPGTVLVWALWIGLVTGLTELVLIVLRKQFIDPAALGALQLNRHAVWMIPASDAIILGTHGLILAALGLFRPRPAAVLAAYGLVFLSAMALLLTFRGLTTITYAVLAVGIAARMAPPLLAHHRKLRRLMLVSLPGLVAVLAGLVAVDMGREISAHRRSFARLPKPRAGAPNVLFIVLDTVRAESLSLHGYGRKTSHHLTLLARDGVRFDRARASASWTLPSHASMFTGRWPHELSARIDRPLDAAFPTLAEYLRDRGYATAGFIANTFFCNGWYGLGRGFIHYEDLAMTPLEILRSSGLGRRLVKGSGALTRNRPGAYFERKDAPTINQQALAWIDGRPRDRPFFAFLNYYDAHDPYLASAEPARRFGRAPTARTEFATLQRWHTIDKTKLTPRDIELARDCYDDCIAGLDEQLGRLFAGLKERGLLDNTVVVVTSDHGEEFGERQGFGHGQSLHHEVIHVPLLIVAPSRVPSGRVVPGSVSLRDLPATLVDLLDLEAGSPFPGRSLADRWSVATAAPIAAAEPVLTEIVDRPPQAPPGWSPPCSLVVDETLYIRNGDGREEFYDLIADPAESKNLIGSAPARPALERSRVVLDRLVPGDTMRR